MANEPQVTTDTAGVARTPDGQIAPPQPTRTRDSTPTPAPTTEPKAEPTDDGKTLLSKDEPKAEPKADEPKGAPEAYTDFKVPDGFTLDPEVAKEAGTLFKGMNLSQDQGQALVDFYTAKTKEAFEAPFKAYQDMRKEWVTSVQSDREMGHRLPEIKTNVTNMLNQHLGPKLAESFREAMDLTGVGDHPAFVRAFDILSQLLVEPRSHVAGAKPSPFGQNERAEPRSAAQAMYPHLPSQSR